MFNLFPLVSEHTIRVIYYFKNEKNTLCKSIENSWESPFREISFWEISEETDFSGKVE